MLLRDWIHRRKPLWLQLTHSERKDKKCKHLSFLNISGVHHSSLSHANKMIDLGGQSGKKYPVWRYCKWWLNPDFELAISWSVISMICIQHLRNHSQEGRQPYPSLVLPPANTCILSQIVVYSLKMFQWFSFRPFFILYIYYLKRNMCEQKSIDCWQLITIKKIMNVAVVLDSNSNEAVFLNIIFKFQVIFYKFKWD